MSKLTHPNYYFSNHFEQFTNFGDDSDSYVEEKEPFANYQSNSSGPEHVFVMFYAPWCGHCKGAIPEMKKAHGGISVEYDDYKNGNYQKHGNTAIVLVNADDHPELAQKHEVSGYPTFKGLKHIENKQDMSCKHSVDYDGGRNATDIEGFISQLDGDEGFTNYQSNGSGPEHVFAMFYAPWCGHCKGAIPEMKKAHGGISVEYDDYKNGNYQKHGNTAIVLVNADDHPEIAQKHDVSGYPTFKGLKHVENKHDMSCKHSVEYDGGRNTADIEGFISEMDKDDTEQFANYQPGIVPNQPRYNSGCQAKKYHDNNLVPAHNNHQISKNNSGCQAKKYNDNNRVPSHGNHLISYNDNSSDIHHNHLYNDNHQYENSHQRQHTINSKLNDYTHNNRCNHSMMKDNHSNHGMMNHEDNHSNHEDNHSNHSMMNDNHSMMNDNHSNHSDDQSQDVFVMFYADWCGHCKSTKPELKKALNGIAVEYDDYISGKYKTYNNKAIVLVNDKHKTLHNNFSVSGYPTMYQLKDVKNRDLYAHNKKVNYQGPRNMENFNIFLQ